MLARGEYGEFFPLKFSPYAYNNSFACLIFALSETQVGSFGANWHEETNDDLSHKNTEVLQSEEIPANIDAVEDDILKKSSFVRLPSVLSGLLLMNLNFIGANDYHCQRPIQTNASRTGIFLRIHIACTMNHVVVAGPQ